MEKIVTLDVKTLSTCKAVDNLVLSNLRVDMLRDEALNCLIYQLTYKVAVQSFDPVEAEWPAGWWQAFKDRWFPGWALKRWPVEMRRLRVDPMVFYPKIAIPEMASVVYLAQRRGVWKPVQGDEI